MKINNIRELFHEDPHIRCVEPSLTTVQKRELWNSIKKATAKNNPGRILSLRRILVGIGAAAIVMSGIFVWHYLDKKLDEKRLISVVKSIGRDFDPTSSNVVLKLSDDQAIQVESEHADVVYDNQGRPVLNSGGIDSRKEESVSVDQLMVPYGKIASLTLGDGTKIWVNSGSKLVYRPVFAKDKREVWLTGEAYFDVAKDEKRPFIIRTEEMDIAVRGTSVNVTAYENESLQTVTLVSGKADVNNNSGKTVYKMEPNQLFSYDRSKNETGISNVDAGRYISWINGYLLMDDLSLDELLTKIDRHYNVRIHYDREDMQRIKVSGSLELQKGLPAALEYIDIAIPISWEIENGTASIELER